MAIVVPNFIDYGEEHLGECLRLFDENCPEFFANNERRDYKDYLEARPQGYFVGLVDNQVVAAFGLMVNQSQLRARLSWILVSTLSQGDGIGTTMMEHAKSYCVSKNISTIDIAASHLSCSFFARFGVKELSRTPNGWGDGMHRVDMRLIV